MYRPNKTLERPAVLALLLAAALTAGTAGAMTEQPTVRATSGFERDRVTDSRRDLSDAGPTVASVKATATVTAGKNADGTTQSLSCCTHYVYDGYTEVFDDFDYDGFHSFLRVNVDIDTDFFESDVYLEVFLRGSTGEWLRIYDSEVFTLYGTSATDDYEVESELLSGFRPDYYDVLVEVFDAYTGELVASYGPEDDSSFALLPLEDVSRDGVTPPPVVVSHGSGGGGALSVGALLLLALSGLARRRHGASATRNLS